jgi:tetratricopeptide (TPR) repeat protein
MKNARCPQPPSLLLQPERVRNYLYRVRSAAIAIGKYRWAIDIFERYRQRYAFTENQQYVLGLLYDHLAMNAPKTRRTGEYLRKAEALYRGVLKRNSKNLFALYGLGRIANIRGDHRKAIGYQLRAYREMRKLPLPRRGALAIGATHELRNDKKRSEQWYKKEYQDMRGDFGTTYNPFSFYRKQGDYRKAGRLLPRLERMLGIEYRKRQYRGTNVKKSRYVQSVRESIAEVRQALR